MVSVSIDFVTRQKKQNQRDKNTAPDGGARDFLKIVHFRLQYHVGLQNPEALPNFPCQKMFSTSEKGHCTADKQTDQQNTICQNLSFTSAVY